MCSRCEKSDVPPAASHGSLCVQKDFQWRLANSESNELCQNYSLLIDCLDEASTVRTAATQSGVTSRPADSKEHHG
jgi:hypothetical protein